jgi:uracil-DNA glycosylase
MTQEEYVRAFDRRNLLPGREWDAGAACVAGRDFRARSRGKIVVVLGAAVWRALGFGAALEPRQRLGSGGAGWLYLPHPSGRSRHYNDQLNRWWAGKTLVELAAPRAS